MMDKKNRCSQGPHRFFFILKIKMINFENDKRFIIYHSLFIIYQNLIFKLAFNMVPNWLNCEPL